MKFTAVLFAGLAAAVPLARSEGASTYQPSSTLLNVTAPDPSTYENVAITSLLVREQLKDNTLQVTGIESVSFTLNSNITCSAEGPGIFNKGYGCGNTPYTFGLINGTTSQFGLRIYKATSQFGGFYGSGDVQTYCRSGGGSIEICQQVVDSTIVIAGQNGIGK